MTFFAIFWSTLSWRLLFKLYIFSLCIYIFSLLFFKPIVTNIESFMLSKLLLWSQQLFQKIKNTECSMWVVQISFEQIQDGGWPPSLNLQKTQYVCDRLTDFDKYGTVMHLNSTDAKTTTFQPSLNHTISMKVVVQGKTSPFNHIRQVAPIIFWFKKTGLLLYFQLNSTNIGQNQ